MIRISVFLAIALLSAPAFSSSQEQDFIKLGSEIKKIKNAKGNKRASALVNAEKLIHKIANSDDASGDRKNFMKRYEDRFSRLVSLGVSVKKGHWDGINCQHSFAKTLISEFPNSQYIADAKYLLMDLNNPYSLEKRIAAFEKYVKLYPGSTFFWDAKLHLARIYDDLWEEYSSTHRGNQRHNISHSNIKVQTQKYKALALAAYLELLNSHPKAMVRKSVKKRHSDLSLNKKDHRKYAEPD